ncbi:hypothetical protein NDU88_000867 [Pleurodeles waltl]|uniref:Secreted protein n=1 Tax=Pleurodeles waltl TaxID=8319 RepID=A0AAV7VVA9_PLEWA|nr:hypothetical protein NDU88_000867 [Pleurodeles waltl]
MISPLPLPLLTLLTIPLEQLLGLPQALNGSSGSDSRLPDQVRNNTRGEFSKLSPPQNHSSQSNRHPPSPGAPNAENHERYLRSSAALLNANRGRSSSRLESHDARRLSSESSRAAR